MEGSGTKKYRTGKGQANLVECLVAFMDILGVKKMTEGSLTEQRQNLRRLDVAMRKALDLMANRAQRFQVSTFSDSIALARALPKDKKDRAEAAKELITRCADLQSTFVGDGIFLRGGITVGRFFFDEHMVFGAGLVNAWRLEDKQAVTPRIVIDRDCEALREILNAKNKHATAARQLLLEDHDGSVFVDYLGWAPAFWSVTGKDRVDAAIVGTRGLEHKISKGKNGKGGVKRTFAPVTKLKAASGT